MVPPCRWTMSLLIRLQQPHVRPLEALGQNQLVAQDRVLGRQLLQIMRLGTALLAIDDVEFNLITLLQAFVAVTLNGTEMTKYIGTVIATDERGPSV